MLKIAIMAMVLFLACPVEASAWEYVKEVYTVKNETLEDIVQYMIEHNTYGKRTRNDCFEALYELNPCVRDGIVESGDQIIVTYWKKK